MSKSSRAIALAVFLLEGAVKSRTSEICSGLYAKFTLKSEVLTRGLILMLLLTFS